MQQRQPSTLDLKIVKTKDGRLFVTCVAHTRYMNHSITWFDYIYFLDSTRDQNSWSQITLCGHFYIKGICYLSVFLSHGTHVKTCPFRFNIYLILEIKKCCVTAHTIHTEINTLVSINSKWDLINKCSSSIFIKSYVVFILHSRV